MQNVSDMRKPKIGEIIHYTGDMANLPGKYKVVEHIPDSRFGDKWVLKEIEVTGDRKPRTSRLPVTAFQPGVGNRFKFDDVVKAEEAERMKELERFKAKYCG